MGGCCCSARNANITGPPVYYCFPRELESDSFASRNGAASGFSTGVFVELDLNTSTPDTFRPPPTPLPYERSECLQKPLLPCSVAICDDIEDSDCKVAAGPLHGSISPKKGDDILPPSEEESCAICLDEYDDENPKLVTKCQHHFHLSCIMEWMERSDTCPMCDQVCFLAC